MDQGNAWGSSLQAMYYLKVQMQWTIQNLHQVVVPSFL